MKMLICFDGCNNRSTYKRQRNIKYGIVNRCTKPKDVSSNANSCCKTSKIKRTVKVKKKAFCKFEKTDCTAKVIEPQVRNFQFQRSEDCCADKTKYGDE